MDWFKKKKRWDLETDVLALGTGAAGALTENGELLRRQLDEFLREVRAA